MTQSPTISVIIPAYNAQETIVRTIESAMAQSFADHEIIVVDDGSAQDLQPMLQKYAPRVRCERQQNAGAASARNRGIEMARGELIAFLDADDTWEPKKLERQIAVLRDHPEVGLVASRYFTQVPGESIRGIQSCAASWLDRVVEVRDTALFDLASLVWTGTILVRREALGTERFVSGLEPAEDRELWLRILKNTKAFVMSEPLATAVLVPGSLSRRDPDSGYGPMLRVVRRHADLVTRQGLRQLEARVFRAWAAAHLADGHPRQALPKALQRLRRQPLSLEAWWIVSKSLTRIVTGGARPAMMSSDGRDETALRRHFEIERELATRLRTADADERRSLYGVVYNELFARVPDHPQNTRKQSAIAQEAAARWQWRLLRKFVRRDSRYLELGAGDCHLAMDVARVSRWSYGVDVSNVIATNGNQPANFSLIISDGVHIDVPRGSIDVAYSNQLMEHLHPDDAAAQLSQIRRALAPGGRYVCITPHRYSGPHDVSQFFAAEACGFHLKEYTYGELRDLLLEAGFGWTHVWTGVKGQYFRVPTTVILGIERVLGALPTRIRRSITRAPLFRMIFINVLLVGCAGGKTQDQSITSDAEEIVARA